MRSLLAALAVAVSALAVSPGASAQTADKDTMVVAFGAEFMMLDPIKAAAGVDHYFIGQMFEQLMRHRPRCHEDQLARREVGSSTRTAASRSSTLDPATA